MPNPEALLPLGGELSEVLGEDPLSHFHRFHHHIDGLAGQFSDDIFPRFLATPVSSHHDCQYFPNRTTNSQDKAVATAQDGGTVKLGEDERPYLAFVRSGMSIDEAKAAAKQIEKATGRTSFNQGEQLSIHSDGSVSAKTEQHGNSVETTYGARGGRERSVEQNKDTRDTNPNGYVDSSFDPTIGNPSMTVRPTNGQVGAWMDPIDPWSYTW